MVTVSCGLRMEVLINTYCQTDDIDAYFGDWVRNKREGQGVLKSPDGKVKDGIWKDNKFVVRDITSSFANVIRALRKCHSLENN